MKTAVRSLVVVFILATVVGVFGFAQEKKDKDKDKGKEPVAGVVFELYKDAGGDFRFRLKDGDTLLAASGKGYKNKHRERD